MDKGFRAAAAAGIFLAALAISGCVSDTAASEGMQASSNTAPASSKASPSPALTIPANIGKPAPAGKLVTTGDATYLQSTIASDDPVFSLGSNTLDASTAAYSAADLRTVRELIVRFTVEEGIDSTLNGGGETPDEWWAKNEDRFHPDFKKEIYGAIKANRSFVMNEPWQQKYKGKYKYLTAADETRIYDRTIGVRTMWSPAPGAIAVQMDVSYKIPATPNVGNTGTGIQKTSGTMTYSASKDPSGEWLIDGFQHKMKTTEG